MSNAIERAYELGWRRSAEWSKRDDLVSDIDSPAYKRERDEDLAHLSAQAKVLVTDGDAIELLRTILGGSYDHLSGECLVDAKHSARTFLESFAARLSQGAQGEAELFPHPWRWRDGAPPHPWSDEWFLAETVYGDRVVLKALPSEYAYDFKTADETYIKSDKIKRWAQFPDSDFVEQKDEPAERAAVPEGLRRFVAMIEAKPLRGSDPDVIYAIHTGTEYAAEIRLSDLKALTAAPQPPEGARAVYGIESLDKPMRLAVALDFADNPRPYHTLQAPADTNGELYRALRTLAAAYRGKHIAGESS